MTLEIAQRGCLDVIVGVVLHGLNSGLLQVAPWTAANLGHQNSGAALERGDDRGHGVVVLIATAAVVIDLAVADELRTVDTDFVDLEFAGVAEVLINAPAALAGDRDLYLEAGARAGQFLQFLCTGVALVGAFLVDEVAISPPRVRVVVGRSGKLAALPRRDVRQGRWTRDDARSLQGQRARLAGARWG